MPDQRILDEINRRGLSFDDQSTGNLTGVGRPDSNIPDFLPEGAVREDFLPALEHPPGSPINQPAESFDPRISAEIKRRGLTPETHDFTSRDELRKSIGILPEPIPELETPIQEQQFQAPVAPVDEARGFSTSGTGKPTLEALRPSSVTEKLLTGIDEFIGKPKSQFADPNVPLTPAQQRFSEQSDITKAVSPIASIGARGAVGVATFLPNLTERVIEGKTGESKNRAKTNLEAFFENSPFSKGRGEIILEEIKGIAKMVGNVPIILDYIAQKALGVDDPTTNANPNSPLVKAYEGLTGKPFVEYYKETINEFIDNPETLAFGIGLGKGVSRGVLSKATGKAKSPVLQTIPEQAKEVGKIEKAQKPILESDRKADIITEQLIKEQVGEKGKVLPLPETAETIRPELADKPPIKPTEPLKAEPVKVSEPVKTAKPQAEIKAEPTKLPDGKAKVPTDQIKPLAKPSKQVELKLEKPVEKQPVKVEKPTPPEKIVGLSKVESDNIRKHTGMDKLDPAERKTFEKSLSEAKEQKLDKSALTTAEQVIKENRPITDAEHSGMVLKAGELLDIYDKATAEASKFIEKGDKGSAIVERTKSNIALDQLDRLTEATRSGRREAARTLSIGRMKLSRDNYDIVQVLDRATVSKGSKLTTTERAKFEDIVKEHKEAVKKNEVLEADYQKVLADQERIVGEKVTEILAKKEKIRSKSKTVKDRILKQRKDIKADIAKLGFRINDVSGVTAEGSFLIGKLAVNYIKEGTNTLDAVVKQVLLDIPEITKRDVIQALNAKDPRNVRKQRSQTHKNVIGIKKQSRLLLEVEKKAKVLPETTVGVKQLQGQLKEINKDIRNTVSDSRRLEKSLETLHNLQDQLDNHFRAVKEKRKSDPAEIAAIKDSIKKLRKDMRLEDTLADLKQQIQTGDFKSPKLREQPKLPKDVNRSQVEVRQLRKKIRGAVQQMTPPTAFTRVSETLNTFRTLKATADMSYTFRQGMLLLANHPIIGTKAFGKAFQSIFSEHKAESLDNALRSVDHHYIRENARLYLPEIRDGILSAREEAFMSNFAERIPGFGQIIKASERHMITGLNHLRAGVFDQFLERNPNATLIELKAWADWVNVTSGRGKMNAAVARGLSTVLFAPRFAYSRVQTPFMLKKYWSEPRVRKAIAKELAVVGGLGMATLGMAKLAGLEVGTDPRSSDFGKIKFGNTRIDMWAGFQQPMRLIIRAGTALSDKSGLTGKHLPYRETEWDALDAFGRFVKYKIAPSIAIPHELLTGKTVIGEETTPSETAIRSIIPIVYEDIADAYREYGIIGASVFGGLNFFGTSTATYKPSESEMRRRLRKLEEEGKIEQMEQERTEWNMQQPTKRIVNVSTAEQSNFERRYNKIVKDFMDGKEGASDKLKQLKKDFPDFEGDIKTEVEIKKSNRKKQFDGELKDLKISLEKGIDVIDKLRNLKRRFPEFKSKVPSAAKLNSELRAKKRKKLRAKRKQQENN